MPSVARNEKIVRMRADGEVLSVQYVEGIDGGVDSGMSTCGVWCLGPASEVKHRRMFDCTCIIGLFREHQETLWSKAKGKSKRVW